MRAPALAAIALLVACASDDDPDAASSAGTEATAGTTSGDDADVSADSESGEQSTGADTDTSSGGDADGPFGDAGEPMSGPMVYAMLCAPCHGNEAQGTALGYELRHPDREYSRWVVRNGRDGDEFPDSAMAAYDPAVVSDAQLDEMFDWLDAFEQPTTGEALYLDYCRNCHGTDPNQGGVVGQEVGDRDFADVLETVREGEGGTNYAARAMYMPALPEDVLSDAEVMAVTDWFAEAGR